jgi:hypothetical protein
MRFMGTVYQTATSGIVFVWRIWNPALGLET